MNILFSAFINPLRKSGVEKKIDGQIKAFENLVTTSGISHSAATRYFCATRIKAKNFSA